MAFPNGHALVIGVGTHRFHDRLDVPVTVRDAEAVANVLHDPTTCGYLPDHVRLLHDQSATREDILGALDELAVRAQSTSQVDQTPITIFFFFCGHGALGTDGNYHLVCHDSRLQDGRVVSGTAISEGELLDKVRAIQAPRILLLFNACYSGNISPSLATEPAPIASVNPPPDTASALLGSGQGRIILTACREQQVSYIGLDDLSYFTQALVDGLRGRGVRNNQGFISAFSLYEHIYDTVHSTVREEIQAVQEPELTVLKGVGPFAVALYKGATTLGDFDAAEPIPELGAVRTVRPEQSVRYFNQRIVDTGGGAYIEAGGSVQVRGGNFVGRDIKGDEVQGDKISVGNVGRGANLAVGRQAQAHHIQGMGGDELKALFDTLRQAVQETTPTAGQQEAAPMIDAIQREVAKGEQADDGRLAGLLEALVDLAPGAAAATVSIFATPLLSGIAGSITEYVLAKLARQT